MMQREPFPAVLGMPENTLEIRVSNIDKFKDTLMMVMLSLMIEVNALSPLRSLS